MKESASKAEKNLGIIRDLRSFVQQQTQVNAPDARSSKLASKRHASKHQVLLISGLR
jgi:hypothetical protein